MPNGNTLITEADEAHMFEVTSNGNVVWNHNSPGNNVMIARAQKYELTYLDGSTFPEFTLGDINFDGEIDIHDISLAVDMMLNVGYNPTPPADNNPEPLVTPPANPAPAAPQAGGGGTLGSIFRSLNPFGGNSGNAEPNAEGTLDKLKNLIPGLAPPAPAAPAPAPGGNPFK